MMKHKYMLDDMEVRGDGGSAKISDDELSELKVLTEQITRDVSEVVTSTRQNALDVRYCDWKGQSSDGRKHKDDLGEDPLPFEGASDSRIMLVDKIVNEHVEEYMLAAGRVVPQVRGMEGSDEGWAQKIRTVLRYMIRSRMDDYRRQVELAAQYMEGDEPGVSLMGVYWRRERALKGSRIAPEDLILIYVQQMQEAGMEIDEETAMYLLSLFESEDNAEELEALVRFIHPQMAAARVKKVVRELYADGEAEFPEPYIRCNTPVLCAERLFDDVFVPLNTTDLQRARVILKRNWYSRAEAKERAGIDGWDDEFVKELLGKGGEDRGYCGMTAFDDKYLDTDAAVVEMEEDEDGRFSGLYEVITAYTREVNSDGVPGIYVRKFSYFCGKAAKDRELLGYLHGKYPFVPFVRERLSSNLLSSRGVSKVLQTHQNSLKLHNDSLEDHVQVNTNPPIKVPPNKPRFQLVLSPFGQIQANAREDVDYMQPPTYPRAAEKQREWVEDDAYDYFGRECEKVSPEKAAMKLQVRVDGFLDSLKQCLDMVIQLSQQYLTDEEIQRIVGGNGFPVARSVEEIQGKFDLFLSFDARDMNLEYVKEKADLFLSYVRQLDTRQTVQYEKVTKRIFESIDPIWAEESLIDPQAADMRERKEEKDALAMILNGIRPDRPEGGQNHALRLQVIEEEMQARTANPDAFEPLSPASRALLTEQVQWHSFQVQQQENAETGRTGVVEEDLAEVE